jgi:hypothetical protein
MTAIPTGVGPHFVGNDLTWIADPTVIGQARFIGLLDVGFPRARELLSTAIITI